MAVESDTSLDFESLLSSFHIRPHVEHYSKKEIIYSQGDPADSLFYIDRGTVRLIVVSVSGKEATLGVLESDNFFGESSLTGQKMRIKSAEAMTDCKLFRFDKSLILQALHQEHSLSDIFIEHMLRRNIRYEADLVDHLFNSCEKRLARILLNLAHYGANETPTPLIPRISQEILAEMVGTTRSRVSYFMNRFRENGYIKYDSKMEHCIAVQHSLFNVVLHD
jgi:CRP/FNR family cyclic AMP-dependent transcriptional regulator